MVTPNIGTAGRIARGISGLLCIVAGIIMLWLHWPESTPWRWGMAVCLIAGGLFQGFEARRGWCIARACGLKTPL